MRPSSPSASSYYSNNSNYPPSQSFSYGFKLLVLSQGCLINLFFVGLFNSVGTIINYIAQNQVFGDIPILSVTIVSALGAFLGFFCSFIVGDLQMLWGHRWLVLFSGFAYSASFLLAAIFNNYWAFLIFYGIAAGVMLEFIYLPSMDAILLVFRDPPPPSLAPSTAITPGTSDASVADQAVIEMPDNTTLPANSSNTQDMNIAIKVTPPHPIQTFSTDTIRAADITTATDTSSAFLALPVPTTIPNTDAIDVIPQSSNDINNHVDTIEASPTTKHQHRRRKQIGPASAIGIASATAGFGGLVMSPLVSVLLDKFHFRYAIMILAGISFVVSLTALVLPSNNRSSHQQQQHAMEMKRKKKDDQLAQKEAGEAESNTHSSSILKKETPESLLTRCKVLFSGSKKSQAHIQVKYVFMSFLFAHIAYLTPFVFLPIFVVSTGASSFVGSIVLGVMNGLVAFGRILNGMLAERFGVSTMYNVILWIGLLSFVTWSFAAVFSSFWITVVFAVLFGFFGSSFFSLLQPLAKSVLVQVVDDLDNNNHLFQSYYAIIYALSLSPGALLAPLVGGIIADTQGFSNSVQLLPITMMALASWTLALIAFAWRKNGLIVRQPHMTI